jgi:hypothetical protein
MRSIHEKNQGPKISCYCTFKMDYLWAIFHFFKIRDFVTFSGPKICPHKGPLFEKLQHCEDFTKPALTALFHCRLTLYSKQTKTRPFYVMYERSDITFKIGKFQWYATLIITPTVKVQVIDIEKIMLKIISPEFYWPMKSEFEWSKLFTF